MQVNKQYKDLDPRVIPVLKYIYKSVEDKTKIDEAFELSFDLLATQLHIYYKALDDIVKNGIVRKNKNGDLTESAAVNVLNKAHRNLQGQLSHFGLTPESLSRIRQYGDKTENTSDIINKLLE